MNLDKWTMFLVKLLLIIGLAICLFGGSLMFLFDDLHTAIEFFIGGVALCGILVVFEIEWSN